MTQSLKKKLTHLDDTGQAHMVDVGYKSRSTRLAVARGRVTMQPETIALIRSNALKKGDVLTVAQLAGIMAAKRTSDLIPLCHPIPIDHVEVSLSLNEDEYCVEIEAHVRTHSNTGVEMEALTAVSVAALAIYDMAKAIDRGMRLEAIRLVEKHGGRSGDVVLE